MSGLAAYDLLRCVSTADWTDPFVQSLHSRLSPQHRIVLMSYISLVYMYPVFFVVCHVHLSFCPDDFHSCLVKPLQPVALSLLFCASVCTVFCFANHRLDFLQYYFIKCFGVVIG